MTISHLIILTILTSCFHYNKILNGSKRNELKADDIAIINLQTDCQNGYKKRAE